MNIAQEVYNKVKILASQKGVSFNQIRLACGLGQNFFVNMRNGSLPRTDNLEKIAGYLGVSSDYLLGREKPTDDDELNAYLDELRARDEMRMFFSVAKNATKEDVEAAVAMIEALNKRRNG